MLGDVFKGTFARGVMKRTKSTQRGACAYAMFSVRESFRGGGGGRRKPRKRRIIRFARLLDVGGPFGVCKTAETICYRDIPIYRLREVAKGFLNS